MNIHTIQFLNSLKNASLSNNEILILKNNKSILGIINLLYKEGLIRSFNIRNDSIIVFLSSNYNKCPFKNLRIYSKPSNTIYLKFSEITKIFTKKKIFFFSTSQGILTDLECKKKRIGGTLFFVC